MKKVLKILLIAVWILLVAGAGALVGSVEVEHYATPCSKVDVSISYGAADVLVTGKEIDSIILNTAGMLKGKPLGYINTGAIEAAVRKQPYVEKVSVYENNEGTLFVDIRQREPLLRIINRKYENFYLDQSGALLPVSPNFSARVLVATGFIEDSYLKNPDYRINPLAMQDSVFYDSLLTNLYRLTMYISHDKFLKAHIEQIYVTGTHEFELIPRVGNHLILLGTADDLDRKFRKLYAFYKYGLNKIGWNKYNVINIKYRNQVVCSKIQ
jgi:cell division protein FtsQ